MKISKQEDNSFNLEGLSFTQLKTIKDACKIYAKQGSTAAGEIAAEIEDMMDNMTM